VEEEMDKVMQEIHNWKKTESFRKEEELQSLISTVKREMYRFKRCRRWGRVQEAGKMKSYSKAVSSKKESIIIVMPKEESDAFSSDLTKRDQEQHRYR